MSIADIINRSQNKESFSKTDIIEMLSYPSDSIEALQLFAESNRISKELTKGQSEVHAQFALNLAPCSCNCKFCSFATVNKIFDHKIELSAEEAVRKSLLFENNGANAIYLMTTASYPFTKFIEMLQEIRSNIKPQTLIIGNVGDKNLSEAKKIKESGCDGVYHAVRMREGIDTGIDPEQRINSIHNFKEAGLAVGTCVEPVGPEHSNEELAEMIKLCSSFDPVFSGSARRITIPGGLLEKYGMISELRMAHIVAVTRVATSRSVKGNCTHEPCTLGALAGANLFWAETGANPRDIEENTEEGRGLTVDRCKNIFQEAGWDILEGSSTYFDKKVKTLT